MKWFLQRMNEASGKAALASLVTIGSAFATGQMHWGAALAAAVPAIAAFATPEAANAHG